MIADTERKFYRVDEAADILGVGEPEIIRLVIDGQLILSAEVVRLLHYEYSSPCDGAPPYTNKEFINGEWFTFSDTLRATSNQLLDIVQSYNLDGALKVLWSKAGGHKFSSLEGDGFQMILALEDGSYIRPITHDGDEWSHYVNIPNDVILGVKRENLDVFIAKAQGSKMIDGDKTDAADKTEKPETVGEAALRLAKYFYQLDVQDGKPDNRSLTEYATLVTDRLFQDGYRCTRSKLPSKKHNSNSIKRDYLSGDKWWRIKSTFVDKSSLGE